MDQDFETMWSDAARLTFDRLPVDVKAGFLKQLPELVARYAKLYAQKPTDKTAVGTVSQMHAPDWSMWLRLDTDYVVDEEGPALFINELNELTKAEPGRRAVEEFIAAVHRRDERINPRL